MEDTTSAQGVSPRPEDEPTVPLWPTAGRVFKMGRSATYDSALRGDFPVPVFRIGRKLVVPTAALRRVLELDQPPTRVA